MNAQVKNVPVPFIMLNMVSGLKNIHVGTCGWTDPTLLESGLFYPRAKMTAEERLKFYAARFDTVEVDSTFYALPSEKVIGLQTQRTPPGFTLHYKAFALLTRHSIDPRRLPKAIKAMLPAELAAASRLTHDQMPEEARQMAWRMFESALLPADSAGKLGVVLFQFPPGFVRGAANAEYILACREALPQYRLAIEFRHRSWVDEAHRAQTFAWLRRHGLIYVAVDEPQWPGGSTVPPLAESTSDIGYIRLHGRNRATWAKKNITAAERFAYDYSDAELAEWVLRIEQISYYTNETFVLFNNCFRNYAVKNGKRLLKLLHK